jgi:hypothetical protein
MVGVSRRVWLGVRGKGYNPLYYSANGQDITAINKQSLKGIRHDNSHQLL